MNRSVAKPLQQSQEITPKRSTAAVSKSASKSNTDVDMKTVEVLTHISKNTSTVDDKFGELVAAERTSKKRKILQILYEDEC